MEQEKIIKTDPLFNLKNKECQKLFKAETSNNNRLSKVFDELDDLDKAADLIMQKLNNAIS